VSTPVVSVPSPPVVFWMVIAWVSSAFASNTKGRGHAVSHRLRWARLAVVLNEARLLACSATAEFSAVSSFGLREPTSKP